MNLKKREEEEEEGIQLLAGSNSCLSFPSQVDL